MSKECQKSQPAAACCGKRQETPHGVTTGYGLSDHFADMLGNCLSYAEDAKKVGRPVVGILCEFTPRELILAAGGVPVCLCGGSLEMIAPAEEVLPANLCPLIKSTFGYHLTRSNPFLEMADLLVAETTCDGKKKMYELMAESRTMHVLELPQKSDDPDALAHWRAELAKLRDLLQDRYSVRIDDGRLRQAIRTTNRYRALRRRLAELMAADRPPLTGRQLLDFKSNIWCMESDMAAYENALAGLVCAAAIPTACAAAIPGRRDPAADAAAKDGRRARNTCSNKVRVLLTGVPVLHGAQKVVDIIESSGGLVVCMENCTGLKPLLQDVDETIADPLDALAEKYFSLPCSVMTPNDRRLESLRRLTQQYRPDCVIDLAWQGCLTYDVESARVKDLAQRELRLPFLRISTDYSPNDATRIALRVEALFETARAREGDARP
jgi:benzoyl-CoA reductase/2-hydroxyglutaryl-CoA dehydratase subunit BcrC/BadD/HgdB